jgi:transketolase
MVICQMEVILVVYNENMLEGTARDLPEIAKKIRREVLRMIYSAQSGHTAGSLSVVEIITSLYFDILNHDPKTPNWVDRDRFVLSCGHVCPAQYAALAIAGYFPETELRSHRKLGGMLQGHPVRNVIPGVETTSGPLGCGLGQACGMALGGRLDDKRFRVFCLTSDGEHDSGNHWEAVLFAAKYKLGNITLLVDRNGIQIDGGTEKVMPLNSLVDKYHAFNWKVMEIDGHNFGEIKNAVKEARSEYQRPTVIIANTIPGKGISFMEGDYTWHGRAPSKDELDQALKELR